MVLLEEVIAALVPFNNKLESPSLKWNISNETQTHLFSLKTYQLSIVK